MTGKEVVENEVEENVKQQVNTGETRALIEMAAQQVEERLAESVDANASKDNSYDAMVQTVYSKDEASDPASNDTVLAENEVESASTQCDKEVSTEISKNEDSNDGNGDVLSAPEADGFSGESAVTEEKNDTETDTLDEEEGCCKEADAAENDLYNKVVPDELKENIPREVVERIFEEQLNQVVKEKFSDYERRLTDIEKASAEREAIMETQNRILEAQAASRVEMELRERELSMREETLRRGGRPIADEYLRAAERKKQRQLGNKKFDKVGHEVSDEWYQFKANISNFFRGLGIMTIIIVILILIITNLAK